MPVEHYAGGGTSAGEWTLAETGSYGEDGTPILLASVRNAPNIPEGLTGKGYRVQSLSRDGGLSWGPIWRRGISGAATRVRGKPGTTPDGEGT